MAISPSPKQTKAELLAAYKALRQEHETLKQREMPAQLQMAKKQEETLVREKTAAVTPLSLEEEVRTLRGKANHHLDELLDQLLLASQRLSDIRHAITIEETHLSTVRNITLGDDALQLLLSEYDVKDRELREREKTNEAALVEARESKKKEWEREQEDYQYTLKLERRKEHDAYELAMAKKRLAFEEDLAKREAELVAKEALSRKQEEETNRMKTEFAALPAQKEEMVMLAKQEVTETLRKEFAIEKRLNDQAAQSAQTLLEATIANREDVIKNQIVEITSLKASLTLANQHAQTLAAKVVEGISAVKQARTGDGTKETAAS